MEFAHPWFLGLLPLCLLPLLAPRRQAAWRYSSLRVLPPDPLSSALSRLERSLGAIFLAAGSVSLAEPRLAVPVEGRWTYGARLVFVIDQSGSMFSPWKGWGLQGPSKLEVARRAVEAFVAARPGDLVGLVGFGRSPVVYTPLTADTRRLREALQLVRADLGDTILDAALLRGLDVLRRWPDAAPGQAVVLLSDGAGRVLEPHALAEEFRFAGARLYWLLIEGGPTPEPAMHRLMEALGPAGTTLPVGTNDELSLALQALGRIESRPIRVPRAGQGASHAPVARAVALVALLAVAAFALGGRPARPSARRRGPR